MQETYQNCGVCLGDQRDGSMIACQSCREWFHHQCVGVFSTIVNGFWTCVLCLNLPSHERFAKLLKFGTAPTRTNSPVIASGSSPAVVTTAITTSSSPLSMQPSVVGSLTTCRDQGEQHVAGRSYSADESSEDWLSKKINEMKNLLITPVCSSKAARTFVSNSFASTTTGAVNGYSVESCTPSFNSQNQLLYGSLQSQQLPPPHHGRSQQQQVEPQQSRQQSQQDGPQPKQAWLQLQPPLVPTPQQLLARQVMPKDLPKFYGNPEDWPLFSSAFTNTTDACGYSNVENLARLQEALQGKALEQVKGRLLFPALVPQVMSTLYLLYGRPELIIQTFLDKVRQTPAPTLDRMETLISFGLTVQNLCDHIETSGQVSHLQNPILLRELIEKVPAQQRLEWAFYKQQFRTVDLRTFAGFMSMLVAAATEVTFPSARKHTRNESEEQENDQELCSSRSAGRAHRKRSSREGREQPENVKQSTCWACSGSEHKVKDCEMFKRWDSHSRRKLIEDRDLCRACFGKHGRRPCNAKHLRRGQYQLQKKQKTPEQETDGEVGLIVHHTCQNSTLFRILPVKLSWNGNTVETFAFLDDGSDMTLVEQSIADRLGIDDGEPVPLCLSWTNKVTRKEPKSQRIRLEIAEKGRSEKYTLKDSRTVASLDLKTQTLDFGELAQKFPYLRGLPVSSYQAATPKILIGTNNANLTATQNLREGQIREPLASKTRLGWTIHGYAEDEQKHKGYSFHVSGHREDHISNKQKHKHTERFDTSTNKKRLTPETSHKGANTDGLFKNQQFLAQSDGLLQRVGDHQQRPKTVFGLLGHAYCSPKDVGKAQSTAEPEVHYGSGNVAVAGSTGKSKRHFFSEIRPFGRVFYNCQTSNPLKKHGKRKTNKYRRHIDIKSGFQINVD